MKNPIQRIKHSISLKLGLGIVMFVAVVFITALGFLFKHSRTMVRQEAMERAIRTLNGTSLRVTGYLSEIKTATDNIEWLVKENLQPDSLLNYSRRVVELTPNVKGCSITMEPYFFPQLGSHFSAYSVQEGDTIFTVREGDYNYYEKVWYKTPRTLGKNCWVDPYDDYNEGTLSSSEVIASYCKPIYLTSKDPKKKGAADEKKFIGVIATDLSLKWLSNTISNEKPYPHSYCIMVGKDGRYLVHPDTAKLKGQTIFSDIDPNLHPDLIALGHQMLDNKTGYMAVNIDDEPCLVFFQPLTHTQWSIALVCTEDDILAGYNRLVYIVVPLIIIGLLLILFFCVKTISHFIHPLNQLAQESRHIAEGHYDHPIPLSSRSDVIGVLQNSFRSMQESINQHINNIQQANQETEARNKELVIANQLAQEADHRKTIFFQDVSHQIRTPLNLIVGFAQVLCDAYSAISKEEMEEFTDTMQQNSITVTRMVSMLFDASQIGSTPMFTLNDIVSVNETARQAIAIFHKRSPHDTPLNFTTNVPDTLQIHTNHLYLVRTVRELLVNAKKFAYMNPVNFTIEAVPPPPEKITHIRFIVEDHGPGISQADQERIFTPFIKLDYYAEGLGLGLGLCQRSAYLLGGTLTLDTTYKEGARFILEIPVT